MSSAANVPAASDLNAQYVEEPRTYVFSVTLTALQNIPRIAVPIDRDADFVLTGINGSSTGSYTLNFLLPSGRDYASSAIQNANLVSPDANQPTAIGPPPLYRAGSNGPQLTLTDTSTDTNAIEIEFSGISRVRTA